MDAHPTFTVSAAYRDEPSGKLEQPATSSPEERSMKLSPANEATHIPKKACVCFKCNQISMVPKAALSAYCQHCDAYIFMDDIVIEHSTYKTNIQTRGNVAVTHDTQMENIFIDCHHLQLGGTISGHFQCSGKCLIKRSQTIKGTLHAKTLIIPRKIAVTFTDHIFVEEAIIHGELTGSLHASRKAHISNHGTIHGAIVAPHLTIAEGGRHMGLYTPRPSHELAHQHQKSQRA